MGTALDIIAYTFAGLFGLLMLACLVGMLWEFRGWVKKLRVMHPADRKDELSTTVFALVFTTILFAVIIFVAWRLE